MFNFTTFDNYNLIIVACLMFMLCYCRLIGETILQHCIECEQFLTTNCLQKLCGCTEIGFFQVIRGALIGFTFSMPMLFCIAHMYRSSSGLSNLTIWFRPKNNLIVYCTLDHLKNSSNVTNAWQFHEVSTANIYHHLKHCSDAELHDILKFSLFVDAIYVILPFSFACSVSCLTWVGLAKTNRLTESTLWNDDMDHEVCNYELAYSIETQLSNLALIFIAGSGYEWNDILVYVFAISVIESFFIDLGKKSERSGVENCVFLSIIIGLFVTFFIYAPYVTNWNEGWGIFLGIVCMVRITFSIMLNFVATGQMLAGHMLLFRLGNTIVVACSLLAFYVSM